MAKEKQRLTRLEILKLVYDRYFTPKQAEMELDGLSVVSKSTLLEVKKGDKVIVSRSASLKHKFGKKKLTVDKIQFHFGAGFCRFTFKGMGKDDWYYENFFARAEK